jgi:PAS domain S-box-containing protein
MDQDPADKRYVLSRSSFRASAAIVASCFLLFLTGGAWYLSAEWDRTVDLRNRELESLGKLKMAQVAHWRRERMGDARFIQASRDVARAVLRELKKTNSRQGLEPPLDWMKSMYENGHYARILVCTPEGVPRSTIPDLPTPWFINRKALLRTIHSTEAVVDDIRQVDSNAVRMHLYVPIRGTTTAFANAADAVVALEIDPEQELQGLLAQWPVPSRTADVRLFRVEDDSIVYLNRSVHSGLRPIQSRIAASTPSVPAAWGAQGHRGLYAGKDERGAEVLSFVSPVPDSPWYIATLVDRDEMMESVSRQAILIGLIIILGLLASVAIAIFVRLIDQRNRAIERLETERRLPVVQQHRADAIRWASDMVILCDDRDRILEANEAACRTYGYPPDELQGRPFADLVEERNRPNDANMLEALRMMEVDRREFDHRTREGRVFPVEVSARLLEVEGRQYVQRMIRDISERKSFEREILRVNRLYRILSLAGEVAARERREQGLLESTCRIAVVEGRLPLVWIGRIDQHGSAVIPLASYGPAVGFLRDQTFSLLDPRTREEPTRRAIVSGRVAVCDNYGAGPQNQLWKNSAETHGIRSSASIPLKVQDKLWGVIDFYSWEPGFFTSEEVHLLETLASSLALAIDSIEVERRRADAEERGRRYEALYRDIERIAKVAGWHYDAVAGHTSWTRGVEEIFGVTESDRIDANLATRHAIGVYKLRIERAVSDALSDGRSFDLEAEIVPTTGSRKWVRLIGHPVSQGGYVTGIHGSVQDISERKAVEELLRQSEERFRSMVEEAAAGYFFVDSEGNYRRANRSWLAMHGFTSLDEIVGRPYEVTHVESERPHARELIEKLLRNELTTISGEGTRTLSDGTQGYHLYSIRTVSLEGSVAGVEGFIIDQTEKRRAQFLMAEQLTELRRWYSVSLGREKRVLELKEEVNRLLAESGRPPRYATSSGGRP